MSHITVYCVAATVSQIEMCCYEVVLAHGSKVAYTHACAHCMRVYMSVRKMLFECYCSTAYQVGLSVDASRFPADCQVLMKQEHI